MRSRIGYAGDVEALAMLALTVRASRADESVSDGCAYRITLRDPVTQVTPN
jgi:hypothetical protein